VLYEPGMSCQLYVCVNFVHYVMLLLANKMMMMMMMMRCKVNNNSCS